MGRKIVMVPPNWEHPKDKNGKFQPMFDKDYEEVAREWKEGLVEWENGGREKTSPEHEYWEWEGDPPDRNFYRTWKEKDATWFQVWETVTEGTPVTPPFSTKKELAEYLVKNGDRWDQRPWSLEAALAFVEFEWAPTFVLHS